MKSTKSKKISQKNLRERPEWLKETLKRAKNSPFAQMTEEEVGQMCEELAGGVARKQRARQPV